MSFIDNGPDDWITPGAPAPAAPLRITVRPQDAAGADDWITPPSSPGMLQGMLTDFRNQGSAAGQMTTPDIQSHLPNLLSTDVHENDSGETMFRDQGGNMVSTDRNQHVVLRDPSDNRLKVFARTDNTNEGRTAAAGRLLMTGLGTGAPTARPGAIGAAVKPPTPGQTVTDAATRLGVPIPRAVTTDSMVAQRAGAAIRNIPGAGDPIIKRTERAITGIGSRADDVAGEFGGGTLQGSGEAASGGIRNWITNTSAANATKLYSKVDELVNPVVTTPLRHTKQVSEKIGAMRNIAALPNESGAVRQVAVALGRPEGLTYEGVKHLRSSVRELLDSRMLPATISQKELEAIYTGLSADLRQSVQAGGGTRALAEFERANKYFRLISERRESLYKIVGVDGKVPPEQVFDRIVAMAGSSSRADASRLMQARKAIGKDEWNEFVSGIVSRMGRDPAARGAPEALQTTDFSPQRFLSAYGKLSPIGRSTLFRSTGRGDLANVLDDIATVSTRFKELQKFSNPSGTGQTLSGFGIGAGAMTEPLTTLGAVVGGRALAYMLANPAKASSVAHWSRAYERLARQPSTSGVASLNVASRNLINNLGEGFGAFTPADFLRSIQGPVRVPAEDEQR